MRRSAPAAPPLPIPGRRRWIAGVAALAVPALVPRVWADAGPRFALGVGSGHPRPDGVVLWTRLTGDGLPDRVPVQWTLADDEGFVHVIAQGAEAAIADDAHSVHAEARGLPPGRWFWYRFEALGQRSAVGRTRTAPARGADATLRAVSASCQRYDHGHYAAWRDAAAQAPDLVLFHGDYLYEYPALPGRVRAHTGGEVRTLAEYRARYALVKSDPLLQAAHAAAPWLVIWDDHEVANDYAGLQSQTLEDGFAARRAAAYRAWWEHQPVSKSMRPIGVELPLHGRLDWGRIARLHLLDTRQHRDPQACPRPGRGGSNTVRRRDCPDLDAPRRSLLGAAQEAWLAEGWDADRPWNLLVQQTLMAQFSWRDPARDPTYWTDGWDGYPAARRRLLAQAHERHARGLVVLGGDVHAHYVADLRLDPDNPRSPLVATEFCGTSISSHGIGQDRIDAARRHNPHVLFARGDRRGYQLLELDAQGARVTLKAVEDPDDPGSAVHDLARFAVDPRQPGAEVA